MWVKRCCWIPRSYISCRWLSKGHPPPTRSPGAHLLCASSRDLISLSRSTWEKKWKRWEIHLFPTPGLWKKWAPLKAFIYPQIYFFSVPPKMPCMFRPFRFQLWRHRFHGCFWWVLWRPGCTHWKVPFLDAPVLGQRSDLNFLYPQSEGLFLLLWCHGEVQAQITSDISTFQKRSRTNSIYRYLRWETF